MQPMKPILIVSSLLCLILHTYPQNSIKMNSRMANYTIKSIPLQFWTCFFLDSETGMYPTIKPSLKLYCRSQGKFLAGSEQAGHSWCIVICVLIYILGLFGFVTNILNALVLRKTLKGSLKNLLVMLAVFDVFACLFTVTFATVIILILENANRGEAIWYTLKFSHILYSFGRTGAIYITVLVTIERYLVVAFPIKSKDWLTPFKSKLYFGIVILLTILLDIPWILNSTIAKNSYAKISPPDSSLTEFPYIMNGTSFARYVYPKIRYVQLTMSYIAPFPLLLLFNGLLYFSIYTWNKNRQGLSSRQKKEMNAAKMFSVVVVILLSCYSVSCVIVFFAQYVKVVHRELMLLQLLSVTLSAAINFLVYFGFGKQFRQELGTLLGIKGKVCEVSDGTKSSQDGDLSNTSGDGKENKLQQVVKVQQNNE